jgi:ubiquinone/menaquinone biosynthesis C-methylase UbiE
MTNLKSQIGYELTQLGFKYNHYMNLLDVIVYPIQSSPIKILDIGGSPDKWNKIKYVNNKHFHITITSENDINEPIDEINNMNIIKHDIHDLSIFTDNQFDVVVADSIIEHIESRSNKQKFANEVTRIGNFVFIRIPNHFSVLNKNNILLWLNKTIQLLQRVYYRYFIRKQTDLLPKFVPLMTKNELIDLFHGYEIYEDQLYKMTQSYIIYNIIPSSDIGNINSKLDQFNANVGPDDKCSIVNRIFRK